MSIRALALGLVAIGMVCGTSGGIARGDETALELFEQRIMPIFRSPNPSSCVQCHLASVDLKDYIRPSHEETFLSLRDQGLIDLDHPEKSKILTLIRMGEDDQDEMAKRIHAKARQAELEAFAAWVKACCADEGLTRQPKLTSEQLAKPELPDEVIRHGRKDRILDSFIRNVWSQRMRCFPCHTPDEIDPNNPRHEKAKQNHREFVQKYGARMNLFQQSPQATMQALINSSRKQSSKQLPLINLEQPAKSLLILKPTSKVPAKDDQNQIGKPSSVEPVSHMGGLKMHVDDVSYKAFLNWIEDLARVRQGNYETPSDLPADNWYPTEQVLRVKDTPEDWAMGQRVQVFVHAEDASGGWNPAPIAFTQGMVTPKRFVNGSLIVLRSGDAAAIDWKPSGVKLPAGDYLLKLYVDRQDRIAADATAFLGEEDYVGQVSHSAKWNEGFPNAEIVSLAELTTAAK